MVVCGHVREVDYSVGHFGSLYIQVLNGPEADSFLISNKKSPECGFCTASDLEFEV